MAKLKHSFILALAAVFSMAGVLTLLTSPALAGPPMSNDVCLNKALRIRDRALEDAGESDFFVQGGSVACTNFCDDTQPVTRSNLYKRQPGQALALITAYITPFPFPNIEPEKAPPGSFDLAYAQSFPHGQVAYFCNVDLVDEDDITSEMEEINGFTKTFIAVGSDGTPTDPCGILQKLCEAEPTP